MSGSATQQETPLQTGYSRLWIIVGGASAGRDPTLLPSGRAGTVRWPGAAGKKLEIPDPNAHNRFIPVDTIAAPLQYPTMTAVNRKGDRPSLFMALRRQQCPVTAQIHFGACDPPGDFDKGWSSIITVIEGAIVTDYTSGEQGAVQSDQRGPIDETVTLEGLNVFDIAQINFVAKAAAESTKPYIGVVVCDAPTCAGLCGTGSDGCQVIFAVTGPLGGSPSAFPGVTYTFDDFGGSEDQSYITPMSTDVPTGIACVGSYVVVINEANGQPYLVYAPAADIIATTEIWTKVETGFVAAHGPRAVFAHAANQVFFVGAGGYIYSTADITVGVAVDDAGDATSEDLNCVHSPDGRVVIVGGDADTILLSTDGGESYSLLPPTGDGGNVTTVLAKNATDLMVGTDDHELYHTENGGITWEQIAFPGHGTGDQVSKIAMPPDQNSVMYMVDAGVAGKGRVLRSYNGGRTWRVAPERETQSLPNNAGFSDLAVCADVNRAYAVGTATGGSLGLLLRGSPV